MLLRLMHFMPVKISKITGVNRMHKLIPDYLNTFDKGHNDIEQVSGKDDPGNNSKGISW